MSTKHVLENGDVRIDFVTGDPEGHRAFLFLAYRNFLKEVRKVENPEVAAIFEKWKVKECEGFSGFPGIQIEYPPDFPEECK